MVKIASEFWTFGGIATVILILVISALLLFSLSPRVVSANVRPAVVLCYLATCGVLVFNIATVDFLVKDQEVWHTRALIVTDFWTGASNGPVGSFGGKDGYVWLVGTLYAMVGPIPLAPIFINITTAALLVITVARLTEVLANSYPGTTDAFRANAVKAAAYATALTPTLVIWVPTLLRETSSWFLIVFSTLMCVQLVRSRRVAYLMPLLASLALLYWIRGSIGLGVSMALLLASAFIWLRTVRYEAAFRFFLLVPLAVGMVVFWSFATQQFNLNSEDLVLHNQALSSDAGSGFFDGGSSSSSGGIASVLSASVPRVLAGPFPWEIDLTSGAMILAMVSDLFWLVAVVFALGANPLRRLFHRATSVSADDGRVLLVPVTVVFALLAMISLSASNYGIIARFRAMPYVVLLPIAALGYGLFRDRVSRAKERRRARVDNRGTHGPVRSSRLQTGIGRAPERQNLEATAPVAPGVIGEG